MHAINLILDEAAAGDADPSTAILDMSGFRNCLFILVLGAQDAEATAQIAVFGCDDVDGEENVTAIEGAVNLAEANSDNSLLVVDVRDVTQRFIFATITRGGTGDTAIGGVLGIQYEPRVQPSPPGLGCLPIVCVSSSAEEPPPE